LLFVRRSWRVLLIVGCTIVGLLVMLTGLTIWEIRRAFPTYDGTAPLPGLEAETTVLRDEHGIPHIYATNALDLFRAQGYVHAQDRFWQMDFRRHVTAGRLSELFGETQVQADTFLRTLGWRRIAEQELPLLSPEARRYLEAYAEGVNAYLGSRSPGELGVQYTLLGLQGVDYVPERWTPVDSLSWLKAIAWDLRANIEDEIQRSLLHEVLPRERVEQLFPPYPYDRHRPILEDRYVQGPQLTAAQGTAAARVPNAAAAALTRVYTAMQQVPDVLGTNGGIGSNSWVVAGSRTTTGMPSLANDPHLEPAQPSVWSQVGLHCRQRNDTCPFEVAGFSLAGLPGVIIGHNDRIGWGFTNLDADVADLFLEQVQGDSYAVPGGTEPLTIRNEKIRVAGGDNVDITIRATRHGPILSDASEQLREIGDGYAVALRWTALDPGRTAEAIFAFNRARGWDDFRAAAALFEVPAQNIVYADVDGHIGYQTPGRVPVRNASDGRWPVEGWTGVGEWTGYVPFEDLPSVRDPAAGFIATANNAVTGPAYPTFLTGDWNSGYRSERIRTLLETADKLDAADMVQIQIDTRNGNAATLVPYLLDVKGLRGYYADGQRTLRNWDLMQPPDSAAAAYFNSVWRNVLRLTFWDEVPRDARPDGKDRWFEVMRTLLQRPDDPFWDNIETDRIETRDDMLRAAMREARDDMTRRMSKDPDEWQWGRLHTLELQDPSFGRSGIGPIEALFNRGPYRLGGGTAIVQATSWNAAEGYEVSAVPSMRMVLDFADFDASQWIDLTGVSGHPYHASYGDQTERWAAGEMLPMRFAVSSIEAAAEHSLTLQPPRAEP
jgi:penicillin G amidase